MQDNVVDFGSSTIGENVLTAAYFNAQALSFLVKFMASQFQSELYTDQDFNQLGTELTKFITAFEKDAGKEEKVAS